MCFTDFNTGEIVVEFATVLYKALISCLIYSHLSTFYKRGTKYKYKHIFDENVNYRK
jgi:hypothetical protein